jgi:hypothetical protein
MNLYVQGLVFWTRNQDHDILVRKPVSLEIHATKGNADLQARFKSMFESDDDD